MIYNEHTVALMDAVDTLIMTIKQSTVYRRYWQCKQDMMEDPLYQKQQAVFSQLKQHYEDMMDYMNYMPDNKRLKQNVYQEKRQLDMVPTVIAFRQAETDLQAVLDDIAGQLSNSISEDIKVDRGNPFFDKRSGCHHG